MENRKKLIEEIMTNFHAMKNKMHVQGAQTGSKDGITHSQLFVLAIIERNQNIGIKEISEKLNISPSATTQLVDGLVENGYVVRKADSEDRRALQLELSPKGTKQIAELKDKRMKMMSALFDVLSDKELEIYLKLHKKILSKINI